MFHAHPSSTTAQIILFFPFSVYLVFMVWSSKIRVLCRVGTVTKQNWMFVRNPIFSWIKWLPTTLQLLIEFWTFQYWRVMGTAREGTIQTVDDSRCSTANHTIDAQATLSISKLMVIFLRRYHIYVCSWKGIKNSFNLWLFSKLCRINYRNNFSMIKILREFIFDDSECAKSAVFAILEALNLDFYWFLYLLKVEIYQINKM